MFGIVDGSFTSPHCHPGIAFRSVSLGFRFDFTLILELSVFPDECWTSAHIWPPLDDGGVIGISVKGKEEEGSWSVKVALCAGFCGQDCHLSMVQWQREFSLRWLQVCPSVGGSKRAWVRKAGEGRSGYPKTILTHPPLQPVLPLSSTGKRKFTRENLKSTILHEFNANRADNYFVTPTRRKAIIRREMLTIEIIHD